MLPYTGKSGNKYSRKNTENHHFVAVTELSVDARVSERLLETGYLQTHISQMTQTGYIAKGKEIPYSRESGLHFNQIIEVDIPNKGSTSLTSCVYQ